MVDLLRLLWCLVTGLFRFRAALQGEILVLRHQVNVLRRRSPKRLLFSNIDRLAFAGLYGLMPSVRNALTILQSATVIPWHRAGFRFEFEFATRTGAGLPLPNDRSVDDGKRGDRWQQVQSCEQSRAGTS